MIHAIAIFGATGDLTRRYLMPALAALAEADQLPEPLKVVGIAPQSWNTARFRRHIDEGLEQQAGVSARARRTLLDRVTYQRADVTDAGHVKSALKSITQPLLAYLALPPNLFAPLIEALASAGLEDGSRLVIEKPFGQDLASAEALNRLLHRSFPEQAVFRVDHFLGMPTVQNLLGVRLGNRVFEQLWDHRHIERVECIWDETLALEGRASYYDGTGALRDMIQNHLLQVLCLIAMEPPSGTDEDEMHDRKVAVLRSVKPLSRDEVARRTLRARYHAGTIGDRAVPAYVDEDGVEPSRGTETFVELELELHTERWHGVPFHLRTGKALAGDRQEVIVHFRPAGNAHEGTPNGDLRPNRLRLPLGGLPLAMQLNISPQPDPGA